MTVNETYYRERADEARLQADESDLVNVRERCLRAAAAWDVMAARIGRTTRLRAATEARKEAERADLLAVEQLAGETASAAI